MRKKKNYSRAESRKQQQQQQPPQKNHSEHIKFWTINYEWLAAKKNGQFDKSRKNHIKQNDTTIFHVLFNFFLYIEYLCARTCYGNIQS